MEKKKYKILSISFLLLGVFILILDFSFNKINLEKEKYKVEKFLAFSTNSKLEENYLGVLEIPKINLKRGFYSLTSKKNHVDKNIQMIETSMMPDVKDSNLILASHSGNSMISFFKNLDRLEYYDKAYVYYNKHKYVYKLIDIYNEKKDGTITIKRRKNQSNLTLITCDKKDNTLQNVYIFKLISD